MTFTVILVGGNSSHEGRLEVYHDGVWGSVCDHGFNDTEASVACRSLGFTYVSHWLLTLCLFLDVVTIVASALQQWRHFVAQKTQNLCMC